MTMISFRTDESDVRAVNEWAEKLGVDRSQILREALRKYLASLAGDTDAELWQRTPLDAGEKMLAQIADWGPAEDWSEWADAAR